MLITIVKKQSYHDSVVLMLLSNELSSLDGVRKISVMMATPANKEILKQSGMFTQELLEAAANDMVIVAEVGSDIILDTISSKTEAYLKNQSLASGTGIKENGVKSWETALKALPYANLAVISVPGSYAALEADRALDENLNVFIFSDNVSIEDEARLKQKAHEKGLLMMGPDCGTGIIHGVPIAFTNNVSRGRIGIIGASGTGIQELITIIDRMGEGVTNAIGVGGRDLSISVGGITMMDVIDAMERDMDTEVLIVISKSPAKEIRERVMTKLRGCTKPVVTLFLGERPEYHEEGLYHAYTLDEAARTAVQILRGDKVDHTKQNIQVENAFEAEEKKTIKAYYSGGTLAEETAMLIKDSLGLNTSTRKDKGLKLNSCGHVVMDLGDDEYTKGKPHPMIDPLKRVELLKKAMDDPSTGVILFDIVLGYGSHEDMAGALLPSIIYLQEKAKAEGRKIFFVTSVCGTTKDYQGYDNQIRKLKDAGVIVCDSNKIAAELSIHIIGYGLYEPQREIREVNKPCISFSSNEAINKFISKKPKLINIGLRSFSKVARDFDCDAVQFDWTPPADGNIELIKVLQFLRKNEINEANRAVINKVIAAQPILIDVQLAMNLIRELNNGKVLLHAGPPIRYENMPDPMKGSCVGAVLFEGWAEEEKEARRLLENGEISFIPCHHVNAVGPMGGITSAHMPLFVVENSIEGNRAYCSMNEGIGKVLRFGAYSEEVIRRLRWMRDVLGPILGLAMRSFDGGLNLNPLIAKAISMGDEFHQRNIAASLVFLKEISPIIVDLDISKSDKYEVIKFLAETDQFFLNIMMTAAKAVMDGARKIREGTVVTAMCRNGENFGIRISGMGDEWFTAPVNTPHGLYFTGYDDEDASPDMGDSAITETYGVGGMAMIAAPAVTRFVGAGGYEDALRISNQMEEITIDHNPNFTIPSWNFKGICLGIDARLVVEKGITPIINTGIAHKVAGYGQIGAGTVQPPIECFSKAVQEYAAKLGYRTAVHGNP